ncbi:type I restriction enzyme M protein [Halopolyspora algeriensis]|uniref:site-specific DNA-methyltransferase (adenine-specific) n=1 Tax=Halopolyspora algeriensis TaxID=1500506 RepID=A0A368VP78_9ACTN|nr:class I SAM-dependent DNA methyltransferase [Halopolyspora algeriensis]RCW43304.1 type I restriction enzyme M protein [Halopolyspora algeriensis]TQM56363.1 type I restriction enzyme M protein [Halopolyspora algeriensis]
MNAADAQAETRRLVDKLWSYCDVLRDEGVSTIDYVEQLTFLLFLKIADEKAANPLSAENILPEDWQEYGWQKLKDKKAEDLKQHYEKLLSALGSQATGSPLNLVFGRAQNKIQTAASLSRLVKELIDKETWSLQGTDVKGDAYEQLLSRGAEDTKTGAGQYFTPRPLIEAMVRCTRPTPRDTITDPACGTGGFLLAAYEHIAAEYGSELTRAQWEDFFGTSKRSEGNIWGTELVHGTARLAAMNLLLHGIGSWNGKQLVHVTDALAKGGRKASLVLANPPFGKKSSITVIGEDGKASREDVAYSRTDFWVTTTNKQLNFVQHIAKQLDIPGRAAVVVPDNVLFEGGAGETVRRNLLHDYDVHTLLRLPTGIFYAGGVKANVLFFDSRTPTPGRALTSKLAVYDFRTNQHFTLKTKALRSEHLDDFVAWYRSAERPEERDDNERVRVFDHDELLARDKVNLDLIGWVADESAEDTDSLLPPEVIAAEIVEDLQSALTEFAAVADALGGQTAAEVSSNEGAPDPQQP